MRTREKTLIFTVVVIVLAGALAWSTREPESATENFEYIWKGYKIEDTLKPLGQCLSNNNLGSSNRKDVCNLASTNLLYDLKSTKNMGDIDKQTIDALSKARKTPVTQPVTSPVTQPVTSPVTQPVTSPVTQPVFTPVTQPVTSPVTQPVFTPVTQTGQTADMKNISQITKLVADAGATITGNMISVAASKSEWTNQQRSPPTTSNINAPSISKFNLFKTAGGLIFNATLMNTSAVIFSAKNTASVNADEPTIINVLKFPDTSVMYDGSQTILVAPGVYEGTVTVVNKHNPYPNARQYTSHKIGKIHVTNTIGTGMPFNAG